MVCLSLTISPNKSYSEEDNKLFKSKDPVKYATMLLLMEKDDAKMVPIVSDKLDPVTTAIATVLIKEGVTTALKMIKDWMDKTEASFSASIVEEGNDAEGSSFAAEVKFDDIEGINIYRYKYTDEEITDGKKPEPKNIAFALETVLIRGGGLMRLKPKCLVFNESAAKRGSKKDINVTYTFKYFKEGKDDLEGKKLIIGPILIEDIKADNQIGGCDAKPEELATDWFVAPEAGNLPYSVSVEVVESATGKGKKFNALLSKIIEDENVKNKLIELLTKKIIPKEDGK